MSHCGEGFPEMTGLLLQCGEGCPEVIGLIPEWEVGCSEVMRLFSQCQECCLGGDRTIPSVSEGGDQTVS